MKKFVLLPVLAALLLVSPSALAATKTVSITNAGFVPDAITIDVGDSITWTLRCEPTGGDHPDAAAACAALTAAQDPFVKLPPPPRCKETPGSSPEVALLEGDFRGRKVRSMFERSNACVAGRWDRIAPVFDTGF